jgi:RES domain-containing protein
MVALPLTDLRRFDTHLLLAANLVCRLRAGGRQGRGDLHKSIEFAEIDWKEREEIGYDGYLAVFTAAFHDLRGVVDEALSPSSYVRSQQLALELLELGSLGSIYPSVRREGGTCIACFRPSLVANVRKSTRYRLIWTPLLTRFVRQDTA